MIKGQRRIVGFDRKVHTADGYTPYQNFSLWDTYRPQNQLLALGLLLVFAALLNGFAVRRYGGAG